MRLTAFTFRSRRAILSRSFTTISGQPSPATTTTTTLSSAVFRRELHSASRSLLQTVPLRHRGFAESKCLNSISSSSAATNVECKDAVPRSEIGGEVRSEVEKGDEVINHESSVPVRAFFASTSVDLKSLVEQNKHNSVPHSSRMTNYVVLRFGGGSDCGYVVVFQYGSIVLFNVPDHEIDGYLTMVKRHASGLLPEMTKDEYEVREEPSLDTWMQGGLDYIMLQHLNTDGVRTIGSVLGQSIALDYYVSQVVGMVEEFTYINREMEKTGNFTMERKKLFQLVGRANSNLADVILKLKFFERSDIAWKDAKYAQIWEYLRDEFELTQRFQSLNFNLKFVQHNIHFFLEILQNKKSDFLEWVIIVLIGVDLLVSIYDIAHKSPITSFYS